MNFQNIDYRFIAIFRGLFIDNIIEVYSQKCFRYITRPGIDLVWQEGRCHRINNVHELQMSRQYQQRDCADEFVGSDDDIDDLQELEFTTSPNGRIHASIHVASAYFGFIIGKGGSTLKTLMYDTKTDIKLPPRNKKGDINISSAYTRNIQNAARRINSIVVSARKKRKPNYFLSIPLNNDEIMKNVDKFKDKVLSSGTFRGVDEAIFKEAITFHLTLQVFPIMDDEELEYVQKLLLEAKNNVIDPICENRSVPLVVSKISYMNDDPTSMHVLYAEAEEKNEDQRGLLVRLIGSLTDFFGGKGFISSKQTGKVHATLMNSSERLKDEECRPEKKIPFDGSKILKDHADYYFGECEVKEIHLSKMQGRPANSYYSSATIVPIA